MLQGIEVHNIHLFVFSAYLNLYAFYLATLLCLLFHKFSMYFSFSGIEARGLICELCRLFYPKDWFSGTGGGISIKDG